MTFTYAQNYIKRVLLRSVTEANPWVYVTLQKWRYRNAKFRNRLVDKNSVLTIEGFPRSANTFALRAFQFAQGNDDLKIANHAHSYAQVLRSVQLGIPTILLIRHPREAIVSLSCNRIVVNDISFDDLINTWDIGWEIDYYTKFYSRLRKVADQVVVAPFDIVVSDFGQIIELVNEKYATNFNLFDHSEENQKAVFSKHRHHLSPSAKRKEFAPAVNAQLDLSQYRAKMELAVKEFNWWQTYITNNLKLEQTGPDGQKKTA